MAEAKKYAKANIVATGDNKSIPDSSMWNLSAGEATARNRLGRLWSSVCLGSAVKERGHGHWLLAQHRGWLPRRAAQSAQPACCPVIVTAGAAYVHYCDNETIQGVEFKVGKM